MLQIARRKRVRRRSRRVSSQSLISLALLILLTLPLKQANLIAPRTLDLTSVKLTFDAAAALADVFSIEWGLRKLILRDCDLDESVR